MDPAVSTPTQRMEIEKARANKWIPAVLVGNTGVTGNSPLSRSTSGLEAIGV